MSKKELEDMKNIPKNKKEYAKEYTNMKIEQSIDLMNSDQTMSKKELEDMKKQWMEEMKANMKNNEKVINSRINSIVYQNTTINNGSIPICNHDFITEHKYNRTPLHKFAITPAHKYHTVQNQYRISILGDYDFDNENKKNEDQKYDDDKDFKRL